MSKNIAKDLRTQGIILKRTNYGEADRILNIITPQGKIAAIAKAARKEKSKLAGGIEMFSLVDLNLHFGKSDFAIVTSARMQKNYSNIIKDLALMETAGNFIKQINQISENSDSPEYFNILNQSLAAINAGINLELIKTWFYFNVARASGEEINLYRDINNHKLSENEKYSWDFMEKSLAPNPSGDISANEIKVMRLILTNKITTLSLIKNIDEIVPSIFPIAKSFA